MARQAVAVTARPMNLAALTQRIQTAVQSQGWTVSVSREGDALVVDLMGLICPDPLLAMMSVEAELELSSLAGLEAVKLYGYGPAVLTNRWADEPERVKSELESELETEPKVALGLSAEVGQRSARDPARDPAREPVQAGLPTRLGWTSVIDLSGYFARRAALPPTAFGLDIAEASRMACAAERDRAARSLLPRTQIVADPFAGIEPVSSLEPEARSAEPVSEPIAEPVSEPACEPDPHPLWFEDPWEAELPEEEQNALSHSLACFPRISPAQAGKPLGQVGPVGHLSNTAWSPENQTELESMDDRGVNPAAGAQERTEPEGGDAAEAATAEQQTAAKSQVVDRTCYDRYWDFIARRSSWFAQTVKDNPRLHDLAKQRQHDTIGTLAHYLVDNLADDEQLVDLVPVRQRDRSCGLIFTDQRAIALSKTDGNNHQELQVWMVPWSWVHKVEISNDALRFHYEQSKERFCVDIEAPYHLRNSIPRDVPVRMVREIAPAQRSVLQTKTGLAMVAGVMFALGSGFSVVNTMLQQQQIDSRSTALAINRRSGNPSGVDTSASDPLAFEPWEMNGALETSPDVTATVAVPLAMTTNHEQCVKSFNSAAQPHAYATLNQVTRTLQVNLQNHSLSQMPPQQFNQIAAAVAGEILESCQTQTIAQVVVNNGRLRYQQPRSGANSSTRMTSVKAEGELDLF